MQEPILLQGSFSVMWMGGNIQLLHLHESYPGDWHRCSNRHRSCNPAARQDCKEQTICAPARRAHFATAVGCCSVQWLLGSHLSWPCIVDAGDQLQPACFCLPSTSVVGELVSGTQFDPYQLCFQHQNTVPWSSILPGLVSSADHICCIRLLYLSCLHDCR